MISIASSVLVPSALAVYTVKIAQLALRRQEVHPQGRTQTTAEYRSEDYFIKVQHQIILSERLSAVRQPSPSRLPINTSPGFFPCAIEPRTDSFDRKRAPLRHAHERSSFILTSGKFSCRQYISLTMSRSSLLERESVPIMISSPFSRMSLTGGKASCMNWFERGHF